ncbi:ComEC/Rec2-related protein [Bartonella australis AUST/NH1]|uniref:ComEC/Rec2-related protein n=1 Tax=Bartonella australis (strain Aust/NH1) TaxID=1094489 RepID=M1N3F0_BARAA|nr:ComEC/Rec2 family competence protein [Bartonella australis]AGF74439.1 ComEC/Rec2-related protein [Bartonella australis AUST/NH1]
MLDQNKTGDGLSIKGSSKKENFSLTWQGYPYIIGDASNATYNEQKVSLFTSLKEAAVFSQKWLADCIKEEISFGFLFSLNFVFFATGAIFYFSLNQEPSWKQFIVAISIFIGTLYILRCYRRIWLVVGVLFCVVLGALSAKIETWRISTLMLDSDVFATLTGRIVSIETTAKGEFRLKIDVLSTEKPILYNGPDRVRLTARHLPPGLTPGDGLYGRVKLSALSGPVRPGSYDFSFHNYFKGIGAQGIYLGKPIKIPISPPGTILGMLSQKIESLRMQMAERISAAISGEEGSVSVALITGQRSGISYGTNEALRTAGLAHILSISGLHMALLSCVVFTIIRSFFAFFPVFSSCYPIKKFAAIAALIIAAFYLVLSGAGVAAQRSFIMIAVMLIAILCNHTALTMRNFAISGLVIITVSPHEILEPSFQMSFSAVAALIAAFDWWSGRRSSYRGITTPPYVGGRVFHFIFSSVISTCVSSFVAGSVSGIYAAYHFSNVAFLGIISNALALPVILILVMPFGLMAAFAMLLGLEWLPLQIMGFGVGLVIKIAHAITAISPVFNPGFMPLSVLILLSLGLIGLTFCKTAIRFFFNIFILAGIFIYVTYSPVQLIIADSAKLVGIIDNGKLYIDRYYAPKFVASVWKKSFHINKIIKPTKSGPPFNEQFLCDDKVCTSLCKNGLKIVILHGEKDQHAKQNITVRTFITDSQTRDETAQITFTPQELLSRGSVMVTKRGDIIWSSAGFHRPWNAHRKSL